MKLTNDDFQSIRKALAEDADRIMDAKGQDYRAGSEDPFANFRRIAERLDLPLSTIAFVYASKHWDSISAIVRQVRMGEKVHLSEPLRGRIIDTKNYCDILYGILQSEEL